MDGESAETSGKTRHWYQFSLLQLILGVNVLGLYISGLIIVGRDFVGITFFLTFAGIFTGFVAFLPTYFIGTKSLPKAVRKSLRMSVIVGFGMFVLSVVLVAVVAIAHALGAG